MHKLKIVKAYFVCVPTLFVRMVTDVVLMVDIHECIWPIVDRQAHDRYANKRGFSIKAKKLTRITHLSVLITPCINP